MSTQNITITRARLVGLLGESSYPNPDDDTPPSKWPHGPGPVSRSWIDILSRIAINPQPLPPRQLFLAALAGAMVERAERAVELADFLPDQAHSIGVRFSGDLVTFEEWCGTMSRWELIQKILSLLKHGNPPPPPPEPWWSEKLSENEIIIVGGRIAFQGEGFSNYNIRSSLMNVGTRLVEKNLGVNVGSRASVLEQV